MTDSTVAMGSEVSGLGQCQEDFGSGCMLGDR